MQSVQRRPKVTMKYRSGHGNYHVRGFLLVDVPTGDGIINVRYCDMAGTRLRRIISFNYLKIILKI